MSSELFQHKTTFYAIHCLDQHLSFYFITLAQCSVTLTIKCYSMAFKDRTGSYFISYLHSEKRKRKHKVHMKALMALTLINVLSYFNFNQCCLMFNQYHIFFNVVVLTVVCVTKMRVKRFQLDISCMSALTLIVMVLC